MDAPQATERFLELLEKSELLSPQQMAAVIERHDLLERASDGEIAEILVRENVINRFQADRLLEGRSRGFFIGRYKLLEILGTGGMGWLYSAEETETGQKVALKVLSDKYKHDAGMLARLKLEADVRFKHPNIVRTYQIDHTEDVHDIHYIIMEWVEGIGLQELIQLNGPLPWRQACDMILQAAAGLHHVHQAGLVHRDVKPENFLIDRHGHVKVLDFGLSLVEDAAEEEFSLAMIFGHDCLGSADYMAPEQWLDSSAVDARADVYGLGCTFYVALTGRVPFPYDTVPKKAQAHRTRPAKSVRHYVPDIPEEVARIVERMMAKNADERFETAGDVCSALAPLAERRPVSFDFQAILAARAADAKRRLAALREQREKQAAEKAQRTAQGDPPAKSPQANIETMIVEDTHPTQPTVFRIDPFETINEIPRSTDALNTASDRSRIPSNSSADAPPEFLGIRLHGEVAESADSPLVAWLVPLDGPGRVPLTKGRVLIGRHTDCDVQLNSAHVSGRHCELLFDGSSWRIKDLGSKNGVEINGTRATEHLLWPGDRITIAGLHHFRFELQPDSSDPPHGRSARLGWLALALVLAASVLWMLLK